MFLTKNLPRFSLAALLIFGAASCVKDVDFDQAGHIALTPEIQTDLLIFDVDEQDFVHKETNQLKTMIRDTVRLEFLDDSYIQNDLSEVEFSFRYHNTFPQAFQSRILFYSEDNRKQHEVSFYVGGGSMEAPAVTERIELIEPENIGVIKRSIKMIVVLEAFPSEEKFQGNLRFESKGLFSFEF